MVMEESSINQFLGYLNSDGLIRQQKENKMDLNFAQFVRKPFVVEAIEVTAENIGEVAKYVGEVKEKDDGTPYIYVDRRLVPNVFRVYPGYFMTRMGDHVRCYSRKVFYEQFVEAEPNVIAWVDFLNKDSQAAPENSPVAP